MIESENDYNLLQKPRKNGFSLTVNTTLLILLLILYKLKMYLSLIINCQCAIVEKPFCILSAMDFSNYQNWYDSTEANEKLFF